METGKENKSTQGNSNATMGKEENSAGNSKATIGNESRTNEDSTAAAGNEERSTGGSTAGIGNQAKSTENSKAEIGNNKSTGNEPDLGEELRKLAEKYDEADYRHWVPIIVADRLENIEEQVQELAPNSNILDSVVEFGRTTDWNSDKKSIIRKAASTVGAAALQAIASAIAEKMRKLGEDKGQKKGLETGQEQEK